MVGQWPLKPLIGVRIPVPQPTCASTRRVDFKGYFNVQKNDPKGVIHYEYEILSNKARVIMS